MCLDSAGRTIDTHTYISSFARVLGMEGELIGWQLRHAERTPLTGVNGSGGGSSGERSRSAGAPVVGEYIRRRLVEVASIFLFVQSSLWQNLVQVDLL